MAYLKYWEVLNELDNPKKLEEVSNKIQQICQNPSVPTNTWVEGIFKHSKMLVKLNKIEEALKTLKSICFILPPMPLPKLNYIDCSAKFMENNYRGLEEVKQDDYQQNIVLENEILDASLFKDDNAVSGDTTDESGFLDLKILNVRKYKNLFHHNLTFS